MISPAFRIFLWTRLLGTAANQMLMVTLAWQMYDLTGRAWDLGMVGLMQFLPALLLTIPAGQLVDRVDRRGVLAASLVVQGLVARRPRADGRKLRRLGGSRSHIRAVRGDGRGARLADAGATGDGWARWSWAESGHWSSPHCGFGGFRRWRGGIGYCDLPALGNRIEGYLHAASLTRS